LTKTVKRLPGNRKKSVPPPPVNGGGGFFFMKKNLLSPHQAVRSLIARAEALEFLVHKKIFRYPKDYSVSTLDYVDRKALLQCLHLTACEPNTLKVSFKPNKGKIRCTPGSRYKLPKHKMYVKRLSNGLRLNKRIRLPKPKPATYKGARRV